MTEYGVGEWQMRNGGKAVVTHRKQKTNDSYPLVGYVHGDLSDCGNIETWNWSLAGAIVNGIVSNLDLIGPWQEPAPEQPTTRHTNGMTLREYYAGQALAGLCANKDWDFAHIDKAARLAIKQADALIEALEKTND